jgi:lysophospholipase L1-like esterase
MTKRTTRVWAGAIVIVLMAVVSCMTGGVANAGRADVVAPRYLALGDSLSFGYSPLLEDPWIPEQFVGYPEIIEQNTGLTTTNLSCPGQTAQALISLDAFDNGCFEFRDAARDAGIAVLHADYDGTQLEAALEAVQSGTPPTLITVQAGGNEFGVCAFEDPDPDQCLADALPKVTESLREVATQLRAAGYRGTLVLVGYHLLPGFEPQMRQLNRAIRHAARESHVAFADTARPFARYAQRHHGDICTTGLLIALPDGTCDIHPTAIGQRIFARAVLAAASKSTRECDRRHPRGVGSSRRALHPS